MAINTTLAIQTSCAWHRLPSSVTVRHFPTLAARVPWVLQVRKLVGVPRKVLGRTLKISARAGDEQETVCEKKLQFTPPATEEKSPDVFHVNLQMNTTKSSVIVTLSTEVVLLLANVLRDATAESKSTATPDPQYSVPCPLGMDCQRAAKSAQMPPSYNKSKKPLRLSYTTRDFLD